MGRVEDGQAVQTYRWFIAVAQATVTPPDAPLLAAASRTSEPRPQRVDDRLDPPLAISPRLSRGAAESQIREEDRP